MESTETLTTPPPVVRPLGIRPSRDYTATGRNLLKILEIANRLSYGERLARNERQALGDELAEIVLWVRDLDDMRRLRAEGGR